MTIAEAVARAGTAGFEDLVARREAPLIVADRGALRVLVLNAPRRRNALSIAMRHALNAELKRAASDPGVRVLTIAGANHTFCSGMDHGESRPPSGGPAVHPNPADAVRAYPKPVIAAVDGVCMTGGLELALATSFIVATDRARFADTHAKIGVAPTWGMTAALPRAIGLRRARQMSLTGEFLDASRALAWGLVNELTQPDGLFARVVELATMIEAAAAWSSELQLHLFAEYDGRPFADALRAERDATPPAVPPCR